ncbi:agamous-like mads-box protein agl61 [Phtheirospermum japonicum]|uniref:Agamous-like mads-box protein agl61 n=1 Tax=Phtheirospermum japonicum TaxID=374723 RepID=A0A830CEJ1_9LAMI|nr:agamous-like mads-box protein agl61 [Phtheirospermum japonicum]
MSGGRQSRGRQRIPMRRINTPDDLYATFSKRRLGLYKKASELSTLCAADVGIIIFSPTNNPFSFWHPSLESVIEQYRNPNQPLDDQARVVEANTRARIEYLNMRLDEVLDEKEHFKERDKQIDENGQTGPKGWWEEIPVESLSEEQVREWKAWFKDLNSKVKNRIDELEIGASSYSMPFQLHNALDFPGPSMFHQDIPSHEPSSRMIRPSQFLGHCNNAPQQASLPFYGDGTSHVPGNYNGLPDSLYGSMGGGINFQFPGSLNHFPLPAQDPSIAGTGSTGGIGESSAPSGVIREAYPNWRDTGL